MSLQGPIVLVADRRVPDVFAVLSQAGAFPVVECAWREVASAIASVNPAAIVLTEHGPDSDDLLAKIEAARATLDGAVVPVLAVMQGAEVPRLANVLTLGVDDAAQMLAPRLRAALRVRALHATVLRRAEALADQGLTPPPLPTGDALDDATVLVTGRGRNYPALTVAIGERVGIVGALSLENAKKYLTARDIDGVVIGDGFNRAVIENFLIELGSDPRWRDLPVVVPAEITYEVDPERLPNLERVRGEPAQIAGHILPFARLHAHASRLKRMIASLDQKGVIDPDTGLLQRQAFMHELARAVTDADARGVGLSLARFAFDAAAGRRATIDAARIVGRLVRATDFACRDEDGSIVVAFTETELRMAHVIARRIASVVKHTALAPGQERHRVAPTIALAALKDGDTADSLTGRISTERLVAAV
jgi:GGDEF domain-containing protein